jgi:hypothetical protein
MTQNEAIVNSLEEKVAKFIALHEQFKSENHRLLNENNEFKNAIRLKDNELKEVHGKYEQLKLAKLLVTGSEDVHEAKLKVNKIVREIDKCIALLNK